MSNTHKDSANAVFNKEKHTILIPDLFPVHMELLADMLRSYGYRAEIVRTSDRGVLDTGLKYIHNDMCYPAICSNGQLLHAVLEGGYDLDKIALLQVQTGGGCRASNYVLLLKKAMEKLELEHIPVISLSFTSLFSDNGTGFRLTIPMLLTTLAALTYGDMMMLLSNQIRPYEINAGDTKATMDRWYARIKEDFSLKTSPIFRLKRNLRKMVEDFKRIPVLRTEKTKVGIVGEVYVKFSALGNNGLEAFLDTQDCEYMLPGVLGFIHYCLSHAPVDYKLYGGSFKDKVVNQIFQSVLQKFESMPADALRDSPEFVTPATFREMQVYGERVLPHGVKMGEGWYLSAEMVELIEHGYNNIICTQPFGCLPNHIVGKGVIRRFREIYPEANICPIDYDASASSVNQENRIKLMLAVAKDTSGVRRTSHAAVNA